MEESPTGEENYILYEDANNLYGWAMCQPLPYDTVKFDNNVSLETILETPDDAAVGYIIEVDLTFPRELHDKFKEFPSCPETIVPDMELMSDFQKCNEEERNGYR